MLEKYSVYLETFEKNEKSVDNFSKFFTVSFSFNEILERQLPHVQIQAYGRDKGRTHLWAALKSWGGGNCPTCPMLATALLRLSHLVLSFLSIYSVTLLIFELMFSLLYMFRFFSSFCNLLLLLQTIHFCTVLRNALSKQW